MDKWDDRIFDIAQSVATWSKDPSTKVACVAVDDSHRILSTGYNGFPRNIDDSPSRLTNRETKLIFTSHAEKNCIYNACFHGISLNDSSVYVYGCPICFECAKGLVQVGVKSIKAKYPESYMKTEWYKQSQNISKTIFKEAGVNYNEIILGNL